ncbi:response regulator transcription factor [Cohnella sp. CFH 77786]|uniref:response regulator n=1 Tax=Cohnella sp. CFH 77786 TaxID=2662265 RepID=UPI001C60D303|nr:response regulator transcription factor [Cohnella sp. CFH 77786]
MDKIKVMLVEDDPFWQRTLAEDLAGEPDLAVTHIASAKEEACSLLEQAAVDVVLMDINLTENRLDGLEAAREIKLRSGRDVKVIMLTSLQEKEIIVRSFQNGAHNYITKASYKDIVQAIRDAHAGRPALHPDAVPALVQEIQLSQLTPSERELYEMREKGYTRSQISSTLNKSINTIKTQLRSIREKLVNDKRD